jgi:hypothetical protein
MGDQKVDILKTIGRNIDEGNRGSRPTLAKQVGLGVMAVHRAANGTHDTSVSKVVAMAEAMGVPMSDIVDEDYADIMDRLSKEPEDLSDFDDDYNEILNVPLAQKLRESFERRATWQREQLEQKLEQERQHIEDAIEKVEDDPAEHFCDVFEIEGEYLLDEQDNSGSVCDRVFSHTIQTELVQRARIILAMKGVDAKLPKQEHQGGGKTEAEAVHAKLMELMGNKSLEEQEAEIAKLMKPR